MITYKNNTLSHGDTKSTIEVASTSNKVEGQITEIHVIEKYSPIHLFM